MKNLLVFLFLLVLILLFPLLSQPSPQQSPDDWMLAFLDVETTGLIPGYHEIVNVGIVLSDVDGNEKARILLYVQPSHPERASQEAVAINGFEKNLWKSFTGMSFFWSSSINDKIKPSRRSSSK